MRPFEHIHSKNYCGNINSQNETLNGKGQHQKRLMICELTHQNQSERSNGELFQF